MGLGGISIWQLLIILVIVLLLFGTKKLRGMGGDLGSAIKSFRKSMKDGDDKPANQDDPEQLENDADEVVDAEAAPVQKDKI
jgi:sec-independent protein translocase protein TatA